MCYRFHLKAPDLKKAASQLRAKLEAGAETRHNIAPNTWIHAMLRRGETTEARLLKWGLVPAWSRDASGAGPLLANARAESAAEKPSFREAFAKRHCIIPASGFFEWEQTTQGKQPWLFHRKDGDPLLFAGLWERWAPENQGALDTCAILTTGPNALMKPLHDRMPVILGPEEAEAWLAGEPQQALLRPCADELLERFRVDPWVNSVHHTGERCILPWTPPPEADQLGLGL